MGFRLDGPRAAAALLILLTTPVPRACAEEPAAARTIRFAEGQWAPASWTSVRMINQQEPRTFTQYPDSIGVTKESFRKDDYSKERDNAVLILDTGTVEGQVEVSFRLGEGFNRYSSPGLALAPVIQDGVMERCIGVFVGHYALAVWLEGYDAAKQRVTYAHLGQLARWTDPETQHVLRCRYSRQQRSLALQIDDSDVLVFQFVGDSRLSKVDLDVNSLIGIWGCHGACRFYELTLREGGTLPFLVRARPPQP